GLRPAAGLSSALTCRQLAPAFPDCPPQLPAPIACPDCPGAAPMPCSPSVKREGGDHTMSTADPNQVILTGENPFIRLSPVDSDDYTTNASYWRIIFSPAGPGHVLYVKSELTDKRWRVYTD